MDRQQVIKKFEEMGSRLTIRKGTNISTFNVITMNVVADKKGEHFTMTIHPSVDEEKIEIQVLDMDKKMRQMLLLIRHYYHPTASEFVEDRNPTRKVDTRLLVGHDEMHWFVAGVTNSKNIKEAFERLRPRAATIAMHKAGVRDKDWRRRKTKGFIRQGEWFFVPTHFEDDSKTIIHKDEPIQRRGSSQHIVEELVRIGGLNVYERRGTREILSEAEYKRLKTKDKAFYVQRKEGAKVLARGRVTHKDHHTVILKGWHEVHLSTESGVSSNAFID